ncbi:unnamed protein product [Brachionus calyciflorus]|uniref:Transmembrane protein 128 n=1 Tax=Brachionus calyciflorus TaxID=104777 RepID=A0A813M3L6_9BILA|nr:unnamed protein product [Brachionus calyciflorus]
MSQSELRLRNNAPEIKINDQFFSEIMTKSSNRLDEKEKLILDKQLQTSSSSGLSIENICWFVASLVCLYISDIFKVIVSDDRVLRTLLYASFLLILVNILIALYIIFYLTKVKKISSNKWNEYNPILIPVATGSFVIGSILLTISLWPVYNWLTAPLLFTIFMGFIVVIVNIPI